MGAWERERVRELVPLCIIQFGGQAHAALYSTDHQEGEKPAWRRFFQSFLTAAAWLIERMI